jgi:hypothetical protein
MVDQYQQFIVWNKPHVHQVPLFRFESLAFSVIYLCTGQLMYLKMVDFSEVLEVSIYLHAPVLHILHTALCKRTFDYVSKLFEIITFD